MATTTEVTLACNSNIHEQFLAMVPIRNLKLLNIELTDENCGLEVQEALLQNTVLSPLVKKYPPSIAYQKMFLKTLLKNLETMCIEICDAFYEEYTRLIAVADNGDENCYRTYTLPNKDRVTLKESTKLVSHGTTGLQTWPAALCLAEWAMENQQLLEAKNIVELGCGLGLTGLIICKTCTPTKYVFTDCHQQVLRNLQVNLEINRIQVCHLQDVSLADRIYPSGQGQGCGMDKSGIGGQTRIDTVDVVSDKDILCSNQHNGHDGTENHCKEKIQQSCLQTKSETDINGAAECTGLSKNSNQHRCCIEQCREVLSKANCRSEEELTKICIGCSKETSAVSMATLDWETFDDEDFQGLQADIILAADVVYDVSIVPSLVHVLHRFLSFHNEKEHRSAPMAIIASTIRNEETYQAFIETLDKHGIHRRELKPATLPVFYYDTSCPIKLLQLSL